MDPVRPATLSGSWYPADPAQLAATVQKFMVPADPSPLPAGRPVLAVVPHAGYAYSGRTAGLLYGLLTGLEFDRVLILAPSHRALIRNVALPAVSAFATPLGEVPLDGDAVAYLAAQEGFGVNDSAHAEEHAVEIQLPFLQETFAGKLRIVPLLVPPLAEPERLATASALEPWCDGRTLFVVSTDFTHYGAGYGYLPFREQAAERLRELDGGAIDRIVERDPAGLLAFGKETGITMCGIDATALALSAPWPPGGEAALIDYRRSGDRDRDYNLSVSYAAVLLTLPPEAEAAAPAAAEKSRPAGRETGGRTGDRLAPADRSFLLELARQVVIATAAGRQPPAAAQVAADQGGQISGPLAQRRGVFVTLTRVGQLRGCIGFIEGIKPLGEAVADNAVAAASRDPRFAPVTEPEVPELHIEISVLTPLREIAGPEEIELGQHGIVLEKGPARALFLPQVAPEQGWDLETTLKHLALKAGLDPDGWRSGARWQVFEAEVFGEETPG